MNRAFCGKSMTHGTDVHHTKPSKFSYSAKPDFPQISSISQKLRGVESSLSTLYIGFLWRRFQKRYLPNTSCHCIRHFGGHLSKMADISKNRPISETKRRRVSTLTICLCFVGHIFHRRYCRIHHAIASTILEAI